MRRASPVSDKLKVVVEVACLVRWSTFPRAAVATAA